MYAADFGFSVSATGAENRRALQLAFVAASVTQGAVRLPDAPGTYDVDGPWTELFADIAAQGAMLIGPGSPIATLRFPNG